MQARTAVAEKYILRCPLNFRTSNTKRDDVLYYIISIPVLNIARSLYFSIRDLLDAVWSPRSFAMTIFLYSISSSSSTLHSSY